MWREPLTGNTGENTGSHNLSTKRQRIAKPARTKRGVAFHLRDFLDRRVRDGVNDNIRERNSSMKNRKREYCTSGSVRGEGGNILTYSAARECAGVAGRGAGAAGGDAGDRVSPRGNASRLYAPFRRRVRAGTEGIGLCRRPERYRGISLGERSTRATGGASG